MEHRPEEETLSRVVASSSAESSEEETDDNDIQSAGLGKGDKDAIDRDVQAGQDPGTDGERRPVEIEMSSTATLRSGSKPSTDEGDVESSNLEGNVPSRLAPAPKLRSTAAALQRSRVGVGGPGAPRRRSSKGYLMQKSFNARVSLEALGKAILNKHVKETRVQVYVRAKFSDLPGEEGLEGLKTSLFIQRDTRYVNGSYDPADVEDGRVYALSTAAYVKKPQTLQRFEFGVLPGERHVRIFYQKKTTRRFTDQFSFRGKDMSSEEEEVNYTPVGMVAIDLKGRGGIHDDEVIVADIEGVNDSEDVDSVAKVGSCKVHMEAIKPAKVSINMRLGLKGIVETEEHPTYVEVSRIIPGLGDDKEHESSDVKGDDNAINDQSNIVAKDASQTGYEYIVYKSPLNRSNGKWKTFSLPLRILCSGDVDRFVKIRVKVRTLQEKKENEPSVFHEEPIGHISRSVRDLVESSGSNIEIPKGAVAHKYGEDGVPIKLVLTNCTLRHFAHSKDRMDRQWGLKVYPPLFDFDDDALDIDEFKRKKAMANSRASSRKSAELDIAGRMGSGTKWQNFKHDFNLYLQSRPLYRFIHKLPLMRSVAVIGRRFSASTEAFFYFFAFFVGLNISLSLVWVFLVILPYAIQGSKGRVDVSANFEDIVAALTIFRHPEGGETALGTWYGDYGPNVARNYSWAVTASILVSFSLLTLQVIDIFRELAGAADEETLERFKFSFAVFGEWEYSCSNKGLREALKSGMNLKLKTHLKQDSLRAKREKIKLEATAMARRIIFGRRVLSMLLSISYIAFVSTVIYYISVDSTEVIAFGIEHFGEGRGAMLPSIITVILTGLVLPLTKIFVSLETWNDPGFETSQKIIRAFLVKATAISVLFYTTRMLTEDLNVEGEGTYKCNQDLLANSFLKLLWTDIIVDMLQTISTPVQVIVKRFFLRRKLRKKGKEIEPDNGKPVFQLVESVLCIVYRQMIILFGLPYCPIMPVVGAIGNILLFYFKSFGLTGFHRPNPIPWNVYRARFMMMKVAFAATCICAVPLSHFLTSDFAGETSGGPFKLQLCCGPHLPWGSGLSFAPQANPVKPGHFLCALDGTVVQNGQQVLYNLVDWKDTSSLGKFMVETIFNPVTLVVIVILMTMCIIVLRVYNKILVKDIKKLNVKSDLDNTAIYQRLEEVGMSHLLE